MTGKISEIFKSIQGEGVYQGKSQAFVRFFGCNLECRFCDTKLSFFQEVTLKDLLSQISSFGRCHSIALTGGEPLLQIDFLRDLVKKLKQEGRVTYLESNGTLPNNLAKIIECVDIVAMDFKLPTSTGQKSFWVEHREFLEIAKAKKVFVKAVIGKDTQIEDVKTSISIIKEKDKAIPFVLQPENPFEEELENKLNNFREIAQRALADVRIIPQLHKKIGIR